jgi:hypothetical protein
VNINIKASRYLHEIIFMTMLLAMHHSMAQPLYPYWDKYNSHFNIYDAGQIKTLETAPVQGFKSGNNICAYITDVLDFKIYADGKSKLVSKFLPKSYDCSDALVAWSSGIASYVYYNGNVKKICDQCNDFTLNDSMLQFTDRLGFFNIFYDNKIRSLDILPTTNFTLGRNLITYVNRNDQLTVWFKDTTVALEYFSDSSKYACGLNTVGFIDIGRKLKVFYNKQVFTLDKLRPKSFVVGDDMVAWVDQNNNLKLFHKGNIFLLETYDPGNFNIIDGIMYYRSNHNELKVFENGKGKVIESYYPTQVAGRNATFVYLDFRNRLKAYSNGEVYSVSEDIVTSFKVYSDLIVYYSNAKSITFWSKGEKVEVQVN